MTRKDYALIAQAMRDIRPPKPFALSDEAEREVRLQWNSSVESLAVSLQLDNPRFDAGKFRDACGYND